MSGQTNQGRGSKCIQVLDLLKEQLREYFKPAALAGAAPLAPVEDVEGNVAPAEEAGDVAGTAAPAEDDGSDSDDPAAKSASRALARASARAKAKAKVRGKPGPKAKPKAKGADLEISTLVTCCFGILFRR